MAKIKKKIEISSAQVRVESGGGSEEVIDAAEIYTSEKPDLLLHLV